MSWEPCDFWHLGTYSRYFSEGPVSVVSPDPVEDRSYSGQVVRDEPVPCWNSKLCRNIL